MNESMLWAAAGALVSGGVFVGTVRSRLTEIRDLLKKLNGRVDRLEAVQHEHEVKLARIEGHADAERREARAAPGV